jgi:TM2 domain-containing membrane protein YozV
MNDVEERRRWMQSLQRNTGDSDKNWFVVLALSIVGGFLGLDRIYLGRAITGSLKLLTAGGLGIWWAVDILLLYFNRMRDGYGGLVRRPF